MRLRKISPLLLLLLPSLAAAITRQGPRLEKRDTEALTPDEILQLNRAKDAPVGRGKADQDPTLPDATVADTSAKAKQTRAFKGTEAAPVDGLDGKPHAGPFVDTTPDDANTAVKGAAGAVATAAAKAKPTSLEKFAQGAKAGEETWKLEDIPEKNDGVMNDENRPVPKKGTTGTEGGVSEKDKTRKAQGNTEQKPPEPKEAPPLPHSEQERIDSETKGTVKKDPVDGEPLDSKKKTDKNAAGNFGIEKPTDLPEKPHNIPHPDPKTPTTPDSDGPWLQDTMPYTEGSTNPRKTTTTKPLSATGTTTSGDMEWHEWFHSFVLSLTMIVVSEIGDKTFLIAALMAMRHPRLLVFSAAFSALIAMTVLSAVLGHAVPTLLPKRFTTFAAACLFLVFGTRMLREGLAMPADMGVGEEMKEVEAELEEKEHHIARRASRAASTADPYALEAGRGSHKLPSIEPSPPSSRSPSPSRRRQGANNGIAGLTNLLSLVLSPAWVQTFIMTFLGEWGDRSQIATIAMAAGQDYWWVTLGAVTGHMFCTGVAVLGGRALAGRVSMRVVTIGGAIAFLVFGVIYLYECWTEAS